LDLTEDLSELESKQSRKLTEVNLIDNNNLPRDWKSNISLDVALKNNFALSLEGTYTKTMKGLLFQSINRKRIKKVLLREQIIVLIITPLQRVLRSI
jgi:hypothetical protein